MKTHPITMNKNTSHTPLKATLCVADNAPNYWIVSTGKWKAPVLATCTNEVMAEQIADALNNANTYAAAPELLEALQSIANDSRLVCNISTGEKHYPVTVDEMSAIRAAIAKATINQ